jgi:transcriptional regulator with XRE-family HTH domain
MPSKTLGKRIRELRTSADLTMRKLGALVDVSAPHIADIEQGNRQPSDELLARLAKALNTADDDLHQYNTRPPTKEMEKLIEIDPEYSMAFRKFVNAVRKNGVSPDKIINISKKLPWKK